MVIGIQCILLLPKKYSVVSFDAYKLTARRRLSVRAVRRIFLCYRLFRFPRLRQKIHPHQSTWKIVIVKGINLPYFVLLRPVRPSHCPVLFWSESQTYYYVLRLRAIYYQTEIASSERIFNFAPAGLM